MMDWKNILVSILLSLIPTAFVAILTVRLSLRQFYSQKWWEKKAEVYSKIIGDLTNLLYCVEEVSETQERAAEINDEPNKKYINKLVKIYSDSSEIIRKTAIAGDFIITRNSSFLLKTFINKINEVGLYPLSFNEGEDCRLINDCLENIRHEAKNDLKVYSFKERWQLFLKKIRINKKASQRR